MQYLKFHRLCAGLTQTQTAKRAGMSQGNYCDIERGRKKPSPKQNARLALAVNRPVEELVAKLNNVDLSEMTVDRRGLVAAK